MAAIAVGSFGILVLLVSYGRFRSMQLSALDQVGKTPLSCEAAVLILLTELRKAKNASRQLLGFRAEPQAGGAGLCELLEKQLRKEDWVVELENGEVVALLRCPEEHHAAAGRRLVRFLQQQGFGCGVLRLHTPDTDAEALHEWLQGGAPLSGEGGWRVFPASCAEEVLEGREDAGEDPPIADSPAVDPLTGVLSPGVLSQSVRHQLAGHRRAGRELTLVRVEVDELPRIRTEFGKDTVERILRKTAVLLMKHCRETDLIGYLGEGEFLMTLPGGKDELFEAVQRICGEVRKGMVHQEGGDIRFSACFGTASMPGDGKNPSQLLERAGRALQEAAARGRGMCLAFQPSMNTDRRAGHEPETLPESF